MKISNIASKIVSVDQEDNEVTFAIKFLVENDTDEDEVFVKLQGLDSDGFEIYDIIESCTIPIGQTQEITRRYEYVDYDLFSNIVKWQPK